MSISHHSSSQMDYRQIGPSMPPSIYPNKYRINWDPAQWHPSQCQICNKKILENAPQGETPCHHTFHRTCLLNTLSRGPFCPQCHSRIPLSTAPIDTTQPTAHPANTDETSFLSEQHRHTYIAQLHDRWAKEAKEMQFHDTAELHTMAARNHFEWAGWEDDEDGFKVGMFDNATMFRKEAVEAEIWAREAEKEGDGERAWREREAARVAGYKAAKAEDMRH